jgi:hypothetical protein
VRRWGLDPATAAYTLRLDEWAASCLSPCGVRWPGLYIISGYRARPVAPALSPGHEAAQGSLHMAKRHGQPASMAVDLRLGNQPASLTPLEVWAAIGALWKALVPGGRWGGDFSPPDPNHFDLGSLTAK